MTHRGKRYLCLTMALLAAGLVGCSEKPQTAAGIKSDQPPYAGSGGTAFQEPGWQAGDRNAWAQHLRARAQYGQNEYSRPPVAAQ